SCSLSRDKTVLVTERAQAGLGCLSRFTGGEWPHAQTIGWLATTLCRLYIGIGHTGRYQLITTRLGIVLVGIGDNLQNEVALLRSRFSGSSRGWFTRDTAFQQGQRVGAVIGTAILCRRWAWLGFFDWLGLLSRLGRLWTCGHRRRCSGSARCRDRSRIGFQTGIDHGQTTVGTGGRISDQRDRKSTRLNSSHVKISYAVFCLKKKKKQAKRPIGLRQT